MSDFSFIIPVYNEEQTIEKVVSDIKKKCAEINDINEYEILIIDDNSTDNSNQIISGNMNQDINFNMVDVQLALNTLVGKIDGTVALRNEQATDATFNQSAGTIGNYSNAFTIQAGNAMNLEAFYLGDINGNFSNEILSD